jgi:hypothetical protein
MRRLGHFIERNQREPFQRASDGRLFSCVACRGALAGALATAARFAVQRAPERPAGVDDRHGNDCQCNKVLKADPHTNGATTV